MKESFGIALARLSWIFELRRKCESPRIPGRNKGSYGLTGDSKRHGVAEALAIQMAAGVFSVSSLENKSDILIPCAVSVLRVQGIK